MLRLIAGAIAVAWAYSGWRNAPRLDHPSAFAFGLCIGFSVLTAYWCGRNLTRAEAHASARAHAEARALAASQSQAKAQAAVNVFMAAPPDERAAYIPQTVRGLDAAAWIGPPKAAAEQDVVAQMIEDGAADELLEEA